MSEIVGPFSGVKVVDFSVYAAGPTVSLVMGYWGADVIKVETLEGDPGRLFGVQLGVPATDLENPVSEATNAFRRGTSIDIKTKEGQEILHKLLADADVFVTNYRPKGLERLGFSYDQLKEKYPRLIYALGTGFGEKGPKADKPGFDLTAFAAYGGFMLELGEPGAPPIPPVVGMGDFLTSINLTLGIATALYQREKTGKGDKITAALYHSALWQLSALLAARNFWDYPGLSIYNPLYPPSGIYECADHRWIAICLMEHYRHWPVLSETLGLSELAEDPRFKTVPAVLKNSKELHTMIKDKILTKERDEWAKIWEDADIPYEILQTHREILDRDQQAPINNFLVPVETAGKTRIMKMVSPPVQFPNYPVPKWVNAPSIGQHTEEVLLECGYSKEQIEDLEARKIIRVDKKK